MNSSTALGQAVDLVDEEDRALGRVGQVGHDVHLLVERGAAGDVELDPQLIVKHRREGRLAQAGRAVEQDMRAAARRASCAAARLIASRSATARWPITSDSRCGRSFSSTESTAPRLVPRCSRRRARRRLGRRPGSIGLRMIGSLIVDSRVRRCVGSSGLEPAPLREPSYRLCW